jgi:hypothetical protein
LSLASYQFTDSIQATFQMIAEPISGEPRGLQSGGVSLRAVGDPFQCCQLPFAMEHVCKLEMPSPASMVGFFGEQQDRSFEAQSGVLDEIGPSGPAYQGINRRTTGGRLNRSGRSQA